MQTCIWKYSPWNLKLAPWGVWYFWGSRISMFSWVLYWHTIAEISFERKNGKFITEQKFWLEDKIYVGKIQHSESLGYIKFLILVILFWLYAFFHIYFKYANFFNKVPVTIQLPMMVKKKNTIFLRRKKIGHLFDRNEYFKYIVNH